MSNRGIGRTRRRVGLGCRSTGAFAVLLGNFSTNNESFRQVRLSCGFLSKDSGFDEVKIDKLGGIHSGFVTDFCETRRFKESLGGGEGGPARKMDNSVGLELVPQYLIHPFTRCFSNTSGAVKYLLPGFEIGDFVDDQDVLHEWVWLLPPFRSWLLTRRAILG